MNFYSFISFLFLFIYLYLGIKTLINDYKNKLNILFSLACFSMVNWNLILGIMYYVKSSDTLLHLINFAYIGKFFFFPLNFHFYLTLTNTKIKRWVLLLFYLPALVSNIAAFLGYSIYSDIIVYEDRFLGLFGHDWIFLYFFNILLCYSASVFVLYRWGKRSKIKKEKFYSKVLLSIYSFAYITALITTILLPILFNYYDVQSIGLVFFYLYFVGLFFLISKFKFMNINYSIMANEIISNIDDIVILLDNDLKIIDVNSKFSEFFSVDLEEIKGRAFFDAIPEYEEIKNKINDITERRENRINLRINYKKDEEDIITKTYISGIKDKFDDLSGFLVISSEIKEIKQFQKYFKITDREMRIIELSISGLTNREISDKLFIKENTVKSHLINIFNKVSVNNKIELTLVAGEFNIKPERVN